MASNPYNRPFAVDTSNTTSYTKKFKDPYNAWGAENVKAALDEQRQRQKSDDQAFQAKQPKPDKSKLTPDIKTNVQNFDSLNSDDKVRTLQKAAKTGLIDKNRAGDLIGKILAAQPVDTSQYKLNALEKAGQAAAGTLKGGANLAGGIIAGGAESINKGILKPFITSPSAALGSAAADATSGKGFDYRKQYKAAQNEQSAAKDITKFVDKKTGTNLTGAVDYADKHTAETLIGTGAVVADVASGGLLTPVIAPAFTAYYGPKYVKSAPSQIKAIVKEPDISKKFSMATEFIGQGILLAKGAKDSVNGVRSLPTTKEVNLGGTVPDAQAREFFNSPNPNLSEETSALLGKALADNKTKFVQELKGGNGVTVDNIQTVPTIYGKLLNIINSKLGRGEPLTPAEEGVVNAATNNPGEFVKTTDVQKYVPPEETTPVPAIAEVPPPLAPPEIPLNRPAPVEPTVPAPAPVDEKAVAAQQKAQAETAKPKPSGTVTTYSGHQGQGSPFSTPDKQFATERFANEDKNGNPVKGIVETKKLDKADILDTRHPGDRAALESVLGKENVDKLIESSGNGLPAHVDKGEQDALIKAAAKLGYKHIALSETDTQTKYNGKDVISYADTSLSRENPTTPAKTEPVKEVAKTNRPKGSLKPIRKPQSKTLTPEQTKNLEPIAGYTHSSELAKDYADMLQQIDSSASGGDMVSDGEGGYKRTTGHSKFYRDYFAGHGKPPNKAAWLEYGTKELESGKGAYGASEDYKMLVDREAGKAIKEPAGRRSLKTSFSSTSGGSAPKPKSEPPPEPKPAAAAPATKVSNPIKKFMDATSNNKKVAGTLDDQLHALGGQTVADSVALSHMFKTVKKSNAKPEDWTAIYHYAEDHNSPISPEQKTLYEATIKPLQDGINDMRESMGLKPFKNDEFIHRIVQGRGSTLERFLNGDTHDISTGNVLKKTSDSMKTRTWQKLVDSEGNTKIVAIKTPKNKLGKALGEKQVTEFKNGQKTPMGALKRKIPAPVHEFYDPAVMSQLESIAKGLGLEHTRTNVPLRRGDHAAGVSYGGTNQIKTKTASPADALLHEIGHQIDDRYGLQDQFLGNIKDQPSEAAKIEQRTIKQELRDLADQRIGEGGTQSFSKYVRTGEEKMAVMFQAYLHAPEIFQAVAPVTFDKFEAFLKSHPETKPIANIEKSLVLGGDTVGDVRHAGEFIDKNGKKWRIENATTKEIEDNSNTRYYKQPLVSTAIDYMQTRQALRAAKFLDNWKNDPNFLYNPEEGTGIAIKSDAKSIPNGWRPTTALQFRGFHFEPRTAEVLDDFGKMAARGDPLGAFTGMNLFLRNTIFYNPLMHVPNIFWHSAMRRGISGLANPFRLARGVSSSVQAINSVVHQDDLYQTMLREGAPLMSYDRSHLSKMIGKMMEDTIQDDKAVSTIAKLAGYSSKANFIKAWYKVSSSTTWGSHDFFMMQGMIEEMKRGLTPQEAIHEVTAHIPDYRLPTRFLGSRTLKTTLSNHNVTMFMPYHYGIFKSYANTVREIAGFAPRGSKQESGWSGRAKTSARGIDKLLMAGVIMFLIYPELDHLARKLTGNENARSRRAGPFTVPYAIYQMLQGRKSIQQTTSTVLPVPPGTKALIQLVRNRDDLNRQIYDPGEVFRNPPQVAKDIGSFLSGSVAPISQAKRNLSGKQSIAGFTEGLVGISTPDDIKNMVQKLYSQQLNLGVQSKAQQRIAAQKNNARNQIAAGQGDSQAKALVTNGIIKKDKLKEFEKTATWTPAQRSFDSLNMVNKLVVLQKVRPDQRTQLGDMNTLKTAAEKTAGGHKANAADRAAAKQIVTLLNGTAK